MISWSAEKAEDFLLRYEASYAAERLIALEVESLLKDLLAESQIEIHLIKCRCKTPSSVRIKLFEKKYKNPKKDLTDIFGARIITYYADDTSKVEKILRSKLIVDEKNSSDKSHKLELSQFGYQSIHLQVEAGQNISKSKYPNLQGKKFEIQIRSILQHVWAEIEHEVVYKGGVIFPEMTRRKFARVAGTLEILEDQFLGLKFEKNDLINSYKIAYENNRGLRTKLDTAKMIALLELEKPNYMGWREAEEANNPFQSKSDLLCLKALKFAGIDTSEKFRNGINKSALTLALNKIKKSGNEITHYTIVVCLVAITNREALRSYFPHSEIGPILFSNRQKPRITN